MMVDRLRPVKRSASREAIAGLTFDQAIDKDLQELAQAGVTGADVASDVTALLQNYFPSRPQKHGGHSLVGRGLYLAQITPWIEKFGSAENVHVLEMGDLWGETKLQSNMKKVFQFVGFDDDFVVADVSVKNKCVCCLGLSVSLPSLCICLCACVCLLPFNFDVSHVRLLLLQ